MSNPPLIQVEIHLHLADRTVHGEYAVPPSETLAELFGRFAREYPLDGPQSDWVLLIHGQPLNWTNTVGEVSRYAGNPPVLVLGLGRRDEAAKKAEGAGGDWTKDDDILAWEILESETSGAAKYPASPAKPAPRPSASGFAVPAPMPAPAAAAPGAPMPTPSEPRRRAPADTGLLREEMPKRKVRAREEEIDEDAEDLGYHASHLRRSDVSRQATVRYYHRMNPQQVYPFLVVLSAEEIAEIVQSGVKQATGERFAVEASSPIEVEPVLPGCQVYPPKHTLVVGADTQTLEFWVVPQVLGTIKGAKVIVRQEGDTLSEVTLEAAVVKQTAAVVVGALSFVMPYVTAGFKGDKPTDSTLHTALHWVATNVRPELIWAGLAAVAAGLYFWCRPRKRDQFWDVTPKG